LWCLLGYVAGDPNSQEPPYDGLFNFTPRVIYPLPPFKAKRGGREIAYKRVGNEFVDDQNRPWTRGGPDGIVEAIVIEEDGQPVVYKVELTKEGTFKADQPARYVEEGGRHRVLTEDEIRLGQKSVFRTGRFLMNLLLNLIHLALWFVCLWLLLRFQWSHALGLAVVFWLLTTLTLVPFLLGKTQEAVRQKVAPKASPTALLRQGWVRRTALLSRLQRGDGSGEPSYGQMVS
jgi:hypothetical protein